MALLTQPIPCVNLVTAAFNNLNNCLRFLTCKNSAKTSQSGEDELEALGVKDHW